MAKYAKKTVMVKRVRLTKPRLEEYGKKRKISEIPTANHWVLKEVLSRPEKARYWRLLRMDHDPVRFDDLEIANKYILDAAKQEVKSRNMRYLMVYTKTLPIKKRKYMHVAFGGVETFLSPEDYFVKLEESKKEPAPSKTVPKIVKKSKTKAAKPRVEAKPKPNLAKAIKEKQVSRKKKTTLNLPVIAKPSVKTVENDEERRPSYRSRSDKPIISFRNFSLSFIDPVTSYRKSVLKNVNLDIYKGETLGLIGESGSGKTVLTSMLTGSLPANAVVDSGNIMLNGVDITNWNSKAWEESKFRGQVVGQVFQNPLTTLNTSMKIGEQLIESQLQNKLVKTASEAYQIAIDVLKRMRINDSEQVMDMYPHQLSGGMRQRVIIATILALKPTLVILDEPTTALDTTVQAEILDIISEIKNEFEVTFIYITHDLGVVASIADAIAIMYAGSIVEWGTTREIMLNPRHPYTWGLLLAIPETKADEDRLWSIPGAVPADITKVKGDPFAPRNPYALAIDFDSPAPMYRISRTHYAATRLLDTNAPAYEPPKAIMKRWRRYNVRIWK